MATILTVDDSASIRQMVSFTLRGAGYEVLEAVDGEDALNKAKVGPVNGPAGPGSIVCSWTHCSRPSIA